MGATSCSCYGKCAVSRSAAVLRAVLFPASSQVGLGAIGEIVCLGMSAGETFFGSLAQLVEHSAFNRMVIGSIPI